MDVDFSRRSGRHSTFGSGPHMCPGQELARAEVAITLEQWLRRIPDFRVAADADTRCSGGIVGQVNRLVLEWDRCAPLAPADACAAPSAMRRHGRRWRWSSAIAVTARKNRAPRSRSYPWSAATASTSLAQW